MTTLPVTSKSLDPPSLEIPLIIPTTTETSKQDTTKTKLSKTMKAILDPDRLEALLHFDDNLVSYNPFSFLMIFRFRGRNLSMLILPLMLLGVLDVAWWYVVFHILLPGDIVRGVEDGEMTDNLRESVERLDELIKPILVPVSFLLVFRLGRAAVRYWDSRAAMGKLVEVCRTFISIAAVGCQPVSLPPSMNLVAHVHREETKLELIRQFARWIGVFPVSVFHFLRPESRADCTCCNMGCNKREQNKYMTSPDLGGLISFEEAKELEKAPYQPIFVLNKFRLLAWQAAECADGSSSKQAILYRQLNEQIDILTGAWGAMERINSTPLPFVYVVHLRTFLMMYLCLWHLSSVALNGWICIIPLLLASWGLLGIEAAAVECERPFHWNKNHLPLGKMGVVVAKNVHQTLQDFGYS